jgi:hypothetical protein
MARKKYLDRDGIVRLLTNILDNGRHFKHPSREINDTLINRIWSTRDWERMTASDRSFVNGFHAAYRRLVIDPQIESGNWFTMPDGSIVYRAVFEPLPDGITWQYLSEHLIRERCGLYWKSATPGAHPYFMDQPTPAAILNDGSENR